MLPLENLVQFYIASTLLALAPGPDNIFVLTQSALRGTIPGLSVVLGLCTGLLFHTLAVSLGVAVIFQTSTVAFTGLKVAGCCYLLYLAYRAFFHSSAPDIEQQAYDVNLWKLYRIGIFMNITNPKVSLFFLAFLPQFTDPALGSVTFQIMVLGALFIIAAIPVFGTIALLAGTIKHWFQRSHKTHKILDRIAGTVFLGLALKLLLSER